MNTDEITINGETYVKKSAAPRGTRAVVVIDRGWIYAGDVTTYTTPDGDRRIRLDRAVWVKKWSGCWLDGVIAAPKSSTATVDTVPYPVDLPADAEIYRIPVADDWGL